MTMIRFPKAPAARTAGYWLFVTAPSLVFFLTVLHEVLASPASPGRPFLLPSAAVYAALCLAAAVAAWPLFGKKRWIEPAFLAAAAALPLVLIVLNSFGLDKGQNAWLFVTTCAPLSVPVLYALSGLGRLPRRPASASASFLFGLLSPFLLAQALLAALTAFVRIDNAALPVILTLATALLCLAFYFFYFRGLNLVSGGLAEKKVSVILILVFSGLLPLLGLFGLLLTRSGAGAFSLANAFGFLPRNYGPGFFIPLLFSPAAGVLLAVRPRGPGRLPLVVFVLRLVLVPYSLSLLLTALPLLAFVPYLLMFLGTGAAFALIPALCFFHVRRLVDDYRFLKTSVSAAAARVPLLLLGLSPLLAGAAILHDRTVLASAYEYVAAPRYGLPAPPVPGAALGRITELSGRDGWPKSVPVIGPLYDALVFEDKSISPETGELLSEVFLGKDPPPPAEARWNGANPRWTAESETVFRPETGDYLSRVTLRMTNGERNMNEFTAAFSLPPGARVSGLRLEINGRYRDAIHVKKAAALFAYENIVRRSRDPAILYYDGAGEIRFRVFPFAPRETRRAEIGFLHLAPFSLELATGPRARRAIPLAPAPGRDAPRRAAAVASAHDTIYLTPGFKASLPLVKRKPAFHFLLDVSSWNPADAALCAEKVDAVLRRYPALAEEARVSLVASGVATYPAEAGWRGALRAARPRTGFYLERALRTVYADPDRAVSPRFPVIVVISPAPSRAIYRRSLADCRGQFPESDVYFLLAGETLRARDLTVHPALDRTRGGFAGFRAPAVRLYTDASGRNRFLRDDAQGALVFRAGRKANSSPAVPLSASPLFSIIEADHDAAMLRAPAAAVPAPFPPVMTSGSSFIVLESERDERAVLEADRNAGKGEKPFSMDEPDILVWIALSGGLLALGAAARALARRKRRLSR